MSLFPLVLLSSAYNDNLMNTLSMKILGPWSLIAESNIKEYYGFGRDFVSAITITRTRLLVPILKHKNDH